MRATPEAVLPVAQVPHLIATKVLSENPIRTNDRSDLQALMRVATERQLEESRRLLGLITERGFHRDRDLEGRFAAFEREFAWRGGG